MVLALYITNQNILTLPFYNMYCVINCLFSDWKPFLQRYGGITHVAKIEHIPRSIDYKIIMLDLKDRKLFNHNDRSLFKMNVQNIETLDNKCLFAKFMMENFPNNIPRTISIKTNTIDYIDSNFKKSMIKKNAIGAAGYQTTILEKLSDGDRTMDTVISEYITHREYYVGHFIFHKGVFIKQIYFGTTVHPLSKESKYIKRGSIKHYNVFEAAQMPCDLTIFGEIFKKLDYSGFACSDFVIVDRDVIIFEINPRPGGSLINNKKYCHEFFQAIVSMNISE